MRTPGPGVKTRKQLRDFESASAQLERSTPLADDPPRDVKSNITIKKTSVPSVRSSASSIVKRKQLELAAAEARAKIELELISKRLEADLAAVDAEDATDNDEATQASRSVAKVEQWLEDSSTKGKVKPVPAHNTQQVASSDVNPMVSDLAHALEGLLRQKAPQHHHEERLLTRLFRRSLHKDKWKFVKANRLCFCCLVARHNNKTCIAPTCDAEGCGMRHHRLLHWTTGITPLRRAAAAAAASSAATDERPGPNDAASTVAHVSARETGTALLKVVRVKLCGPKGQVITHALLDDAASVSLISADLVDYLGLKSEQSSPTKFIDAFGIEVYHSDAPIVRAKISACDSDITNDIKFRKCNLNLPAQDLSIIKRLECKHLLNIKNKVEMTRTLHVVTWDGVFMAIVVALTLK
ncbi:hypothetical protein ACJJTC_015070 [Scirpophaga incertulas]